MLTQQLSAMLKYIIIISIEYVWLCAFFEYVACKYMHSEYRVHSADNSYTWFSSSSAITLFALAVIDCWPFSISARTMSLVNFSTNCKAFSSGKSSNDEVINEPNALNLSEDWCGAGRGGSSGRCIIGCCVCCRILKLYGLSMRCIFIRFW